jgi:phosphate transport system permease protein
VKLHLKDIYPAIGGIFGIIGFSVFAQTLGLGWSLASGMLTLALMLIPIQAAAFLQILSPLWSQYGLLCQSLHIRPAEFLFWWVPRLRYVNLASIATLAWTRALGETAAVMLTSGAVLDMPSSLFDSARALSYHIFILGMETPGGLPEAKSLCFLTGIIISSALFVSYFIQNSAKTSTKWLHKNLVRDQAALDENIKGRKRRK